MYPPSKKYYKLEFQYFAQWVAQQQAYELDIETNLEEDITLKEIYIIQFGSTDGQYQFVLEVNGLSDEEMEQLKGILRDDTKRKLGHNLLFEYSVITQCWGVHIDNLFDSMILLKMVLNGKYMDDQEVSVFTLKGALKEYLGISISKNEQKTFTSAPLTENQIIYAGTDVMYVTKLCSVIYSWSLKEDVFKWDEFRNNYTKTGVRSINPAVEMQASIDLRMKAIPAFGEILVNAFTFNKDKWDTNILWAQTVADQEYLTMAEYLRTSLWDECVAANLICPEDRLEISWNSTTQKTEALKLLYPELVNTKLPALRTFEKTLPDGNYIKYILDKKYDLLNYKLVREKREILKGLASFHEKGKILINFNSPQQRLALFRIEHPEISNTKEETLNKLEGHLIESYQTWIKRTKLVSSYGANFYDFICSDGNIRARMIDMVLTTGRVAIKKPGLQTIPADEGYYVGNRYREAFECPEGWSLTSVDFGSQELNVIGDMAEEPAWIKANRENLDIHSISAGLVFKDKWLAAGGDPFGDKANVKLYGPEAKEMRSKSKTASFGLAYGLGPNGASKKMNCTILEAKETIDAFYDGLPAIKKYFDKAAKFGQTNGWIATMPPYNFRRNFPNWNSYYIANGDYSQIGRESKNFRIQAMGAEQSFEAMYLIYKEIKTKNLWDKVKIVFMLHDATNTLVRDDFAQEWGKRHTELMEQGATINVKYVKIPGDLTITKTWTK